MEKLIFCEECRRHVEYTILEELQEYLLEKRNIKVHYTGKNMYCKQCGNAMYHPELHDYNLEKLNEELEKDKQS